MVSRYHESQVGVLDALEHHFLMTGEMLWSDDDFYEDYFEDNVETFVDDMDMDVWGSDSYYYDTGRPMALGYDSGFDWGKTDNVIREEKQLKDKVVEVEEFVQKNKELFDLYINEMA